MQWELRIQITHIIIHITITIIKDKLGQLTAIKHC